MKSEKGIIAVVFVILILVLILLLVGIIGIAIYEDVSYGDKEGTIINKYYKEPYTTTSYVMSGRILVPITDHHAESWNFELQKEIEGKNKTITIEVTKDIYYQYNVGDYFKESKW